MKVFTTSQFGEPTCPAPAGLSFPARYLESPLPTCRGLITSCWSDQVRVPQRAAAPSHGPASQERARDHSKPLPRFGGVFFMPETEASLFAWGRLTWYQVWTARRLYFINTPAGNPVEPPETKEGELPLGTHVPNVPRATFPALRQGFWRVG